MNKLFSKIKQVTIYTNGFEKPFGPRLLIVLKTGSRKYTLLEAEKVDEEIVIHSETASSEADAVALRQNSSTKATRIRSKDVRAKMSDVIRVIDEFESHPTLIPSVSLGFCNKICKACDAHDLVLRGLLSKYFS